MYKLCIKFLQAAADAVFRQFMSMISHAVLPAHFIVKQIYGSYFIFT